MSQTDNILIEKMNKNIKISIIVVAYNQLEYTKLCVKSILHNTDCDYELILINNGSTDGTKEVFKTGMDFRPNTVVINYDKNEIVEEIANNAIGLAKGEYIVGITNDTICPKNWLPNMMNCFNSEPNIGIVGVRSNCISGKQQCYPGLYESLDEYYKVAYKFAKENNKIYYKLDRIVGMFTLFRRDDFIKVGGYNVNLPTNGKNGEYGFSDDDICQKFVKAGYKNMVAGNVFVHHFGGLTIRKNTDDDLKVSNFKLGIGIPCSYNHIPFPFFTSFAEMEKPEYIPLFITAGSIEDMRNLIVQNAIMNNCSHLIMMDTDQLYPRDTIKKLLSHNLPVVGCMVCRRYPPFDPLLMKGEINKYETIDEWEEGSLLEVDATGTGCLMFDMEVFDDMPAPWFKFRPNPDKDKNSVIGEDIGFCSDLKQAGYKIYVDTSIECPHLSILAITKETWRLYKNLKKQQNNNKNKEVTNNECR